MSITMHSLQDGKHWIQTNTTPLEIDLVSYRAQYGGVG